MNKDFAMKPERALQTAPVVYLGEGSRAAASFNPEADRTRSERRISDRRVPRAESLSLDRSASRE